MTRPTSLAWNSRLETLIAVAALTLTACGGAVTATPIFTVTAAPTASATAARTSTSPATPTPARSAAPTATPSPAPTPRVRPTIGQPADDGARIIAVDANPPVIRCTDTGCSDPVVVPHRRARDLTIDSPAVGTVQVRLLLPAHFDGQPTTRWPVLYLFPGGDSPYTNWTEWNDVEAMTAKTDLLIVMPTIGDGSYSDGLNGGKWETFHLVELRQLLERNWQVGEKRAVAGFSRGGFGAMQYATRQPHLFAFAASFSGDLGAVSTGYAQALKGVGLFVSYGNGEPGPLDNGKPSVWDPSGDTERFCEAASKVFVAGLAELKVPVTVDAYGNGTHHELYWDRELLRSLPLILKALGE